MEPDNWIDAELEADLAALGDDALSPLPKSIDFGSGLDLTLPPLDLDLSRSSSPISEASEPTIHPSPAKSPASGHAQLASKLHRMSTDMGSSPVSTSPSSPRLANQQTNSEGHASLYSPISPLPVLKEPNKSITSSLRCHSSVGFQDLKPSPSKRTNSDPNSSPILPTARTASRASFAANNDEFYVYVENILKDVSRRSHSSDETTRSGRLKGKDFSRSRHRRKRSNANENGRGSSPPGATLLQKKKEFMRRHRRRRRKHHNEATSSSRSTTPDTTDSTPNSESHSRSIHSRGSSRSGFPGGAADGLQFHYKPTQERYSARGQNNSDRPDIAAPNANSSPTSTEGVDKVWSYNDLGYHDDKSCSEKCSVM